MPVLVPANLRFSRGATKRALDTNAVDDLLALGVRIQSPNGEKSKYEAFKRHFATALGTSYASSSSLSWAESDFWRDGRSAAEDAPNFIASFWNACEDLQRSGSPIPDISHLNEILAFHDVPFRVENGHLVELSIGLEVESPAVPLTPRDLVGKALADATSLMAAHGATSAIDRLHTALHGYLRHIAEESGIGVENDESITRIFKRLREKHPALRPPTHRRDDVERVLQSLASVVDSLSTIRNKASLAHANELLDGPEAMVAINAARTILRYIIDCIERQKNGPAP